MAGRASTSSRPARRRRSGAAWERRTLTAARVDRYLKLTQRALSKLKIAPPPRSYLRELAEDFLKMARAYAGDAATFRRQGALADAFACVNYAHGWLDAGARLGLFDVGGDDQLFTLYR